MAPNRHWPGGQAKRPRATDYYDSETKRNKTDGHFPGDSSKPALPLPSRGSTYHPEPNATPYARRDFSKRRSSEGNKFFRPGVTSASASRKSPVRSPTSLSMNALTGSNPMVLSSPHSYKATSANPPTSASAASSRAHSPSGPIPTHSSRTSPPAPIRTDLSNHDFVRSGSVETMTSQVASTASITDRYASNSSRKTSAALDPRKCGNRPSNLQTSHEDLSATNNHTIASSLQHSTDVMHLLSEAKAKRENAINEVTRLKAKVGKLRGGASTVALDKVEKDLSQKSVALKMIDDEIGRLETLVSIHESPRSVVKNMDEPDQAKENHESSVTLPSPLTLQEQSKQGEMPSDDVAELRKQFFAVSEALAQEKVRCKQEEARREKENAEREKQLQERDRQFAELQQQVQAIFVAQQADKRNQAKAQQDQEKHIKERIRVEYETLYEKLWKELKNTSSQIQSGTTPNMESAIKVLQQQSKDQVKNIRALREVHLKSDKNIDDLRKQRRNIEGSAADVEWLVKELERQKGGIREINSCKENTAASTSRVSSDLSAIRKAYNALGPRFETMEEPDPTAIPNPSARLDALETLQKATVGSMQTMGSRLMETRSQDDLDILEEALMNTAYHAAKLEASTIATSLTARIDSTTEQLKLAHEAAEIASVDALKKVTARIESVENKLVPDEGFKTSIVVCENELGRLAKAVAACEVKHKELTGWTGLDRDRDDPGVINLREMITNLEHEVHGPPDQAKDDEPKPKSILYLLEQCETKLVEYEQRLAQLEQPKLDLEDPKVGSRLQQDTESKISSLESNIETRTSALLNAVQTTINNLSTEQETLSSQMPQLRKDLQQEKAAHINLEGRISNLNQQNSSVQSQLEAVKTSINLLRKSTWEAMHQFSQRMNDFNPDGIAHELKVLNHRGLVTQAALQSLEGRYNAITTTSLVQKMLDQVHSLLPAGTDILSLIKELNEQKTYMHQISDAVKKLSASVDSNKNSGEGGVTTLAQNVEKYKQTVETTQTKVDTFRREQEAILIKLSALQNQLGLDDTALTTDPTLRQFVDNSINRLQEGLGQLVLEHDQLCEVVEKIKPGPGRSVGDSEDVVNHVLDKLSDLPDQEQRKLIDEAVAPLADRVGFLEEENSKASTASTSVPNRFAKKEHFDELREIVRKHGRLIDTMIANTENAKAEVDESDDDIPLAQRRLLKVPMMGNHPVQGSHKANRPRQQRSSSNGKPPRRHGSE